MPFIHDFKMLKQQGSLFCWVAAAKSVIEYYTKRSEWEQDALVSRFVGGGDAGDPERILRAATILKNVERLDGSNLAEMRKTILKIRINESLINKEPVVVFLDLTGGGNIGHVVVIYGYEDSTERVYMKDPSRPDIDIEASVNELLFGWAPYDDGGGLAHLRCYAKKICFTQKPPFTTAFRF
jgi:hypothetical protein